MAQNLSSLDCRLATVVDKLFEPKLSRENEGGRGERRREGGREGRREERRGREGGREEGGKEGGGRKEGGREGGEREGDRKEGWKDAKACMSEPSSTLHSLDKYSIY